MLRDLKRRSSADLRRWAMRCGGGLLLGAGICAAAAGTAHADSPELDLGATGQVVEQTRATVDELLKPPAAEAPERARTKTVRVPAAATTKRLVGDTLKVTDRVSGKVSGTLADVVGRAGSGRHTTQAPAAPKAGRGAADTPRTVVPGVSLPAVTLPGLTAGGVELGGVELDAEHGLRAGEVTVGGVRLGDAELGGIGLGGIQVGGEQGLTIGEIRLPGLRAPGLAAPGLPLPALDRPVTVSPAAPLPDCAIPSGNAPAILFPSTFQGLADAAQSRLSRVALPDAPSAPAAPRGPRPTGPVPAQPAGTGTGADHGPAWALLPSWTAASPSTLGSGGARTASPAPRDRAGMPLITPD